MYLSFIPRVPSFWGPRTMNWSHLACSKSPNCRPFWNSTRIQFLSSCWSIHSINMEVLTRYNVNIEIQHYWTRVHVFFTEVGLPTSIQTPNLDIGRWKAWSLARCTSQACGPNRSRVNYTHWQLYESHSCQITYDTSGVCVHSKPVDLVLMPEPSTDAMRIGVDYRACDLLLADD